MNYKIILSLFIAICIVFCNGAGVGGRGSSSGSGIARSSYAGVNSKVLSRSGSYPYALAGIGNEYDRVNKKSKEVQPKATGRNVTTTQIVYILTIILSLGFVGYYFIQFYPFLCSKESKYDVMSRSSVTPTHSREFEYDESTSSATKSTNASYSGNEHDV